MREKYIKFNLFPNGQSLGSTDKLQDVKVEVRVKTDMPKETEILKSYSDSGKFKLVKGIFQKLSNDIRKYVIRMKQNRNLKVNGKTLSISNASDLADFNDIEIKKTAI